MSWLARSLTSSLRIDADADERRDGKEDKDVTPHHPLEHDTPTTSPRNHEQQHYMQHHRQQQNEIESEQDAEARGVKDDLNEFTESLSRQIRGMASFLAPHSINSHPSSPKHYTQSDPASFAWNQSEPSDSANNEDDDDAISRIGSEFSDIEGRLRRPEEPGFSGTDPNSNMFESEPVGNESDDFERPVGITEEVLAFARNIAMHPETWLDFPIDEEDDIDNFTMSDAQQEHGLAIERLSPRFAALRIELCPFHMSRSYFWKVYFVLLHSRLNKQDADILSTPQVMAARAMWMKELQKQTRPETEWFGRGSSYSRDNPEHEHFAHTVSDDAYSDEMPHGRYGVSMMADYETEKHRVESSETHCINKSVIEEKPMIKTEVKDLISRVRSSKIIIPEDFEDDDYEWPELDGETTIPMVNEEDISFSDLEDDDYDIKPIRFNTDSKA